MLITLHKHYSLGVQEYFVLSISVITIVNRVLVLSVFVFRLYFCTLDLIHLDDKQVPHMFKSSAPTNRVRQQAANHRFTTAAHQPFDYGIKVWCFVYDNFLIPASYNCTKPLSYQLHL